jgi:hypothetical protein
MGFAFFGRGFAAYMGKREARRNAILTVLKILHGTRTDPRTLSGGAALVMLSSISEKMPDLAASAWFDKHTEKDAIIFMREWDKAAKEFGEHNPVRQKAKRKSRSKL